MQKHIRSETDNLLYPVECILKLIICTGERESVERTRGDREERETPRMRKLELAEIENAKREKARKKGSREL